MVSPVWFDVVFVGVFACCDAAGAEGGEGVFPVAVERVEAYSCAFWVYVCAFVELC